MLKTEPSRSMIEADRLRAVLADSCYQQTIGKWMRDTHQAVMIQMAIEDEPVKNARLRGTFLAFQEIFERIDAVLRQADIDALKLKDKQND